MTRPPSPDGAPREGAPSSHPFEQPRQTQPLTQPSFDAMPQAQQIPGSAGFAGPSRWSDAPPIAGPAGAPPGSAWAQHHAIPTYPAPAASLEPAAPGRRRLSGWRVGALTSGVALVVAAASVGGTLALDKPAPAMPSPAASAAAAAGAHAAGSSAIGEPTASALLSHYQTVINKAQEDALPALLCGGTGRFADSAPEWSWAFLALHEQVKAGPLRTTATGTTSLVAALYRGQQEGVYDLIAHQVRGRWCVQAVDDGTLGTSGGGK